MAKELETTVDCRRLHYHRAITLNSDTIWQLQQLGIQKALEL